MPHRSPPARARRALTNAAALLAVAVLAAACGGGGGSANAGPLPSPDTRGVAAADPGSALPPSWKNGALMEIYVRGYQDSDGDGIGDLRGLILRLDHLKALGIKPHTAAKEKGSAVDGRTKRSKGYAISMVKRKRIEECFGWAKTVGGFRKTRFIGTAKVQAQALLTFAAWNLTRMMSLLGWRSCTS